MAETFVDEGLDYILGIWPKGGSLLNSGTLYFGLYTGGSPSAVPAAVDSTSVHGGVTLALGTSGTALSEATGTAYARTSLATGSWGSQASASGGRKITGTQLTFATVGAGGWGTVNGFFMCTDAGNNSNNKIIFIANFDDTTPISTASGDVIKITPTITLGY